MVLTAKQHLKIALLYEKAAADRLGVPQPQRAAFSRKAKWFRMKARIRAKKEAASALRAHIEKVRLEDAGANQIAVDREGHSLDEARRNVLIDDARLVEQPSRNEVAPARRFHRSIAERITAARPTQG